MATEPTGGCIVSHTADDSKNNAVPMQTGNGTAKLATDSPELAALKSKSEQGDGNAQVQLGDFYYSKQDNSAEAVKW
jgi:hypothetical protein